MSLEKEISVATEKHSKCKKLRNSFYIATGTAGISLISVPYIYQTLANIYDKETASAGVIIEALTVGGIAFICNTLYKTYKEKTKSAGKEMREARLNYPNHNNNI